MNYIKGKYKNSIYTSESGYTVGLFRVKESDVEEDVQNKTITFTGFFPELNTEDTYLFYGKYIFMKDMVISFKFLSMKELNQKEKMLYLNF